MSRRALRKPDPSLDTSGTLIGFDDLPPLEKAAALLEGAPPLEIDVGCGKGMFLVAAAAARPETNFLGIELAGNYARYAAGRLAKAGLANAQVLHADARRVFAERLIANSIHAVHVYFPDPWWKKRHQKRQVMTAEFVKQIERVLVPGGSLHYWTDVEERFVAILELLAAQTTLAGPFDVPERAAEHQLDYRTNFERRTRLASQRVFRAEFRNEDT